MPLVAFDLPEGKSWDDPVDLHLSLTSTVLIMAALQHYIERLDEEAERIRKEPLSLDILAEMAGMQETRQELIATSIRLMEQAMPDIVEEAAKNDPAVARMREQWLKNEAQQADKA